MASLSPERSAALLRRYHDQRCPQARRRLIEAYLPLVRSVARRFVMHGEPLDDLVQEGCIGLIHAVDHFDPDRGLAFEAYAVPSIAGAIRRHLRDRCATVRLPRELIEQRTLLLRMRSALELRAGRPVTLEELARATRLSLPTVASALAVRRVEPLDEDAAGAATDPIGALEDRITLTTELRRLSARDRRILALHFYGDQSQRGIADRVALSQIHVSRLMRGALEELRVRLETGGQLSAPAGGSRVAS